MPANTDERYARLMVPGRWVVCGRRMQPFCLGHAMVLHWLGNPFAGGEEREPGLGDLAQAVWVCSQSWERARERFGGWRWRVFLWRFPKSAWAQQVGMEQLRQYLTFYMDRPNQWTSKDKRGRDLGAPYLQLLRVRLMTAFHMSHADAMNYPLNLASWDLAGEAELQGAKVMVNEQEAAIQEEVRRAQQEVANG